MQVDWSTQEIACIHGMCQIYTDQQTVYWLIHLLGTLYDLTVFWIVYKHVASQVSGLTRQQHNRSWEGWGEGQVVTTLTGLMNVDSQISQAHNYAVDTHFCEQYIHSKQTYLSEELAIYSGLYVASPL